MLFNWVECAPDYLFMNQLANGQELASNHQQEVKTAVS